VTRSQIIISISGLLLVILLFSLPKVVVDNDEDRIDNSEEDIHSEENRDDPQLKASIQSLKDSLSISTETEKSAIFADSLAESYRALNHFDSVALVYEESFKKSSQPEMLKKAADAYFEAYTFAVEDNKRKSMADQAKKYYAEILKKNSGDLEAKTNLGMLYVGTENPMQGIGLLREVLESDPSNYGALYNMGILSLQSNQVSKAIERFEDLVEAYPESSEGRFYLGLSYLQAGENEKARTQFEIVKETDSDPSVQATVDTYLEEIE